MPIRSVAIILTLLTFIAGCATTDTAKLNKGEELLSGSQKLIASLDQLAYEEINLGECRKFAFGEETTVLQEGDRRRFVKGFLLPVGKGTYSVSVTTYKQGTLYAPAILYPEVTLLDKNFRAIRTLRNVDFVYRSRGFKEGLNAVFFVNNNSQGETFLLISNRSMEEADLVTSQASIQGSIPIVVAGPGVFAMWSIPTGKNTPPIKMRASPTGEIEVELKEYRPKRVGE